MKTDTVYRYLGGNEQEGILSCGYMAKNSANSQLDFTIPYYSCFVLLRGTGLYWDKTGVKVPLTPGCVVQRLPDRCHSTVVDEGSGWLEFYISFGRSALLAMESTGMLSRSMPVRQGNVPTDRGDFDRLLSQLKSQADAHLFPLLLQAQQIAWSWQNGTNTMNSSQIWLKQAQRLLEEAPGGPCAAQYAAQALSMGYENFRKQFTRLAGQSPNGYRMNRRMLTAKLMLMDGQPIKTIAMQLGYSDSYTFSKQFKLHTGISPAVYRETLSTGTLEDV